MKKLTSIFLAIAMILTLAPMNIMAADSAFSDVKDTDYYAQAAIALEQLEILSGYPDGTFGPEKSITRAEMAAVVCRLIDKEADAESAKGATKFDDVTAEHWASGYVNVASEEGIVNGDGNGKFRPGDSVKYEEAIKMVVCALGYGDDVTVNSSDWSAGYLKVAKEKGISDNLKGMKGQPSTRGDVAVMSYNGITADLEAPKASLKEGSYIGAKKVKLTAADGAEIYYTINGSMPTAKSTKYEKEILIEKSCTLKAVATKDGILFSDALSVEYGIKLPRGDEGTSSKPKKEEFTVSFDLNYDGATGAPASQKVEKGELVEEPDVPKNGSYQFVGWYIDKDETDLDNYYDFSTPVESDMTLFAKWMDMTDTDGDGLVDGVEELCGTDKTIVDTDNDGLNDYVEVFVIKTNPLLQDSNNNGTNDGDEDFDNDGISNITEINGSTDPVDEDTDNDGLIDGEEVASGTNPNKEDTDEDGVSDGKEIELGTDPLVAQSTFSMNLSADNDGGGATASVQIDLSGEQVETLSVEPVENDTFFPEDMPGYMGQAYDFSVDGEFDSAIISFEFDASELGPDADPVIYYYNEENQELEELETTVNGNVASAEVTHFSKYILVDRKVYQQSFTWQDVWESDHNYTDIEIVFVVDDSGSMTSNDPYYERLTVARTLIDNLPSNSKIGLVRFDGGYPKTEALTPMLTKDKEAVKNFLTRTYFYSPGGTDMYNGIQKAFPLYEATEDTTLKMMIVLSDGITSDTHLHSSVISTANANNIRIYTVGLGNSTSYFNSYMKPLANNTAGEFYLASDATQLADIYKDISEKIDIETDSDDDGVPDYYEDNMIIFSGVKLTLDKNNPDTDGDGIPDGKEVVITKDYNDDKTKVIVTGKLVLGDPTKKDTDHDGYNDGEDLDPLNPFINPVILIHGRNDDTLGAFGVKTGITGNNKHYDSDVSMNGKKYSSYANQKITEIENGKLGKTLDKAGYTRNINLFAFNYPNQDMNKKNAGKFEAYINNLIDVAKKNTSNYKEVMASDIYATKSDLNKGKARFILIGHSNGGLVSRYYIENLGGSKNVDKLITINTPHYGSGIAYGSDVIDLADIISVMPGVNVECFPMDVDLNPSSTLFNGGKNKYFVSAIDGDRADYINKNQTPKLKGNEGVSTVYYAIGGYDVQSGVGPFEGEMGQIPEGYRWTRISFYFDLDASSKSNFKKAINDGLRSEVRDYSASLDMGNSDGDNVVDIYSQFGLKVTALGGLKKMVSFSKTGLIVDTIPGDTMSSHFHSKTLSESDTREMVKVFVND